MWAHGQIAKIKGRKKVKPKMPADHSALLRSGLSFSSVLTTVYTYIRTESSSCQLCITGSNQFLGSLGITTCTVHSISAPEARKDLNVPQLKSNKELPVLIHRYIVILTTEKHCAAKHFLQPKAGFWCKIEQNSSRVSGTCRLLCFWSTV